MFFGPTLISNTSLCGLRLSLDSSKSQSSPLKSKIELDKLWEPYCHNILQITASCSLGRFSTRRDTSWFLSELFPWVPRYFIRHINQTPTFYVFKGSAAFGISCGCHSPHAKRQKLQSSHWNLRVAHLFPDPPCLECHLQTYGGKRKEEGRKWIEIRAKILESLRVSWFKEEKV